MIISRGKKGGRVTRDRETNENYRVRPAVKNYATHYRCPGNHLKTQPEPSRLEVSKPSGH